MATNIESKYAKIRDQCLAMGKPWEDRDFPADATSLGPNPGFPITWKRPHEICGIRRKPEFMLDGGDRFDILQGNLGDCWMLSALASLTASPQLLKRVVPHDQTFHKDTYAGVFRFHFWKYGEWIEVLVDDRLPVKGGRLEYANSSPLNEFWVPLLEKAYAKFYGNYKLIVNGRSVEALTDFTGCLTEIFFITNVVPEQLSNTLLKAAERNTLLSTSVNKSNALQMGLPTLHVYSITGVRKIKLNDNDKTTKCLIRVRNPWGNAMEWKGRWCDSSAEWKTMSSETLQELKHISRNDGEFWIELNDFRENFETVELCYLNAADIFLRPEKQRCWSISTFHGKWITNKTAWGMYKNCPSFAKNPQFVVTLEDSDEDTDNMASFVVELTQKNRRRQNLDYIVIGFQVFSLPSGANPPMNQSSLTDYMCTVGQCRYKGTRAVSKGFREPPGTYVIIPTTQLQNEEAEFMLRVLSETDHKSHAFH